jgi:hypothetical protein
MRSDGWRGRGAWRVNRRGDLEAAEDGRGGKRGSSGGRGRGSCVGEGSSGSGASARRVGGAGVGVSLVVGSAGVRDAAASWGGIMRSRLGAWARPTCERAREPPHPLAAGARSRAPGPETWAPPASSTSGRTGPSSGAGLCRAQAGWSSKPTIVRVLPRCRSLVRRRADGAQHLLQGEAAVDSARSPLRQAAAGRRVRSQSRAAR